MISRRWRRCASRPPGATTRSHRRHRMRCTCPRTSTRSSACGSIRYIPMSPPGRPPRTTGRRIRRARPAPRPAALPRLSNARPREGCACPAPDARHIPEPMAGSPLKRARKQGIRLEGGSVIAFPYMPRVADLPSGWRHFSAAQKIEHLIGLDRCYEILSWGPITEIDPLRRSFQMQVMRILLPIGIKAYLDRSLDRAAGRERNRATVLGELDRKLRARAD